MSEEKQFVGFPEAAWVQAAKHASFYVGKKTGIRYVSMAFPMPFKDMPPRALERLRKRAVEWHELNKKRLGGQADWVLDVFGDES